MFALAVLSLATFAGASYQANAWRADDQRLRRPGRLVSAGEFRLNLYCTGAMLITISHNKTRARAIQAVDQAIGDVFRSLATGPMTLTDLQKSWNGSVLTFSLTAKMGFLQNPIVGTIAVSDRDVTIDADLGLLSKLFSAERLRSAVESRVRGLLT